MIAHGEPAPDGTWRLWSQRSGNSVAMPSYTDDMPLYERAEPWDDDTRCFETPVGAYDLDEDEAYALYRDIAELTSGVLIDTTDGARTILGIRVDVVPEVVGTRPYPRRCRSRSDRLTAARAA